MLGRLLAALIALQIFQYLIYRKAGWFRTWRVSYPRDGQAHQLEARLPFPIRFGAPALSLAIRHSDLSRGQSARKPPGPAIAFGEVRANEMTGPGKEPLDSVFNAITLLLLAGQSDIDGVARNLGVGVQSLQRDLRREGVDFRSLLNLAKKERAQALLADTTLPVIDIAFSLGYSDQANFSCAFKRMVGVAPLAYRSAQTAVH